MSDIRGNYTAYPTLRILGTDGGIQVVGSDEIRKVVFHPYRGVMMDAIRKFMTDVNGKALTPETVCAMAVQFYHHVQDVYEGYDRDKDVIFCSCVDCESFAFMFGYASAGMRAATIHDEECGTDPDAFVGKLIVEMDVVSAYPDVVEKIRRNAEYGRNNAAQN